MEDTNTKIQALEKQIADTDDKDEIRKLKNKIFSYQNRLSNMSTAKDMDEKIKSRNTLAKIQVLEKQIADTNNIYKKLWLKDKVFDY